MSTAAPIEADFTTDEEPYAPSAVPRSGPDRGDVLTQMRLAAAEAIGVAAGVEMNAHKLRPEFVDAWRRWFGLFSGRHIALERLPWEPNATDAEVRRWQDRLRAWRAGLAQEPGMTQPASAAPTPAAQPAPTEKKGWPTWAKLLGLGGAGILLWKVGQWIFTPSYTSTAQVVNDVVETTDAVNAARRGR